MLNDEHQLSNRILTVAAFIGLFLLGGWLRWRFIQTVHLYPDEFVTLLAVRMIGETGLPVMPSGLFYDHGLLFSYLGAVAALFGPTTAWVRYASLLCGLLTIGLIFRIGRRWFSPAVGLITAAGLVIAPTAIHWSGRARMYALLQLLTLLTVWLLYEAIRHHKPHLHWLALLTYLGAMLTQFAAVALAPPLVVAILTLERLSGAEAQRGRGGYFFLLKKYGLEGVALVMILLIAFLVKRAGQPKGIEALDSGNAISGILEVFTIYSDFSFNLVAGWMAIASFYWTLPALIFTPFALVAVVVAGWKMSGGAEAQRRVGDVSPQPPNLPTSPSPSPSISPSPHLPTLFLALILLLTTLEIIFLVSPERRDAKYIFMLLPLLLLLGAQGMRVIGYWLLVISNSLVPDNSPDIQHATHNTQYALRTTHYVLRITFHVSRFTPVLVIALILRLTQPVVDDLLSNIGDDYEAAFAYVEQHWQAGDVVMTGTPAAAALYLGRNDFYSVQKRGGYDYRLLEVEGQIVDRWLASPAIRTADALHNTLAHHTVWLVLERWGLQREYYDLPFQQQLLAQTEPPPDVEAQGMFVLRSKPHPQPLSLAPAHLVEATFGDVVQLTGYTVEPEQLVPGHTLRLTLYWQALAPMSHDYTVFVHLRHPNGGNAAQADHRPLGDLYPTTLWPVGETIRESSDLPLPPDLSPGLYEVWVGLYLLETGERLPVRNDTSGENAVKLGVIEVGS